MEETPTKPNLKKMTFIMNALENGWSVKKIDDKYIFTKKHENRKEVFKEDYLWEFIETNFDLQNNENNDIEVICKK